MKKFEIIVSDEKFFISGSSEYIFTLIYIECDGICFPDNKWTDFTFDVLSMWEYQLLDAKKNKSFILYFMDGPFRMDVFMDNNMQLTINCVNERGPEDTVIMTMQCSYFEFLEVYVDAINKFKEVLYLHKQHITSYSNCIKYLSGVQAKMRNILKNQI